MQHSLHRESFKVIKNAAYSWQDCIMSGLAVFGFKMPSLLQFEKDKATEPFIRRNLRTLYGVTKAPSDTCMRERLDTVDPRHFKPAVERFLSERGLELSIEKTRIVHIKEGFNFLGFNIQKYGDKLIIKPAKENVKRFLTSIRDIIKKSRATSTENLLQQLNPKIRGWTNYYRNVVSKETFASVDAQIFKALWKWAKRRHPEKNAAWIEKKYFRSQGLRRWLFHTKVRTKDGTTEIMDLIEASRVTIKRHVKIRAAATPYDPAYESYFKSQTTQRAAQGNRVNQHEY